MSISSFTQAGHKEAELVEKLRAAFIEVHSVGVVQNRSGFRLSVECRDVQVAEKIVSFIDGTLLEDVDIFVCAPVQI
jgi:hypothetical protein